MKINIYTDGGARPTNPGPGAWGFVILEDNTILLEDSDFEDGTTNNKMELQAVIQALNSLYTIKKPKDLPMITVHSDSAYVVKGMNEWMKGWKAKSWAKVKNVEYWQELDELRETYNNNIKFVHVKAHNGNQWNEYCDEMCTNTILTSK